MSVSKILHATCFFFLWFTGTQAICSDNTLYAYNNNPDKSCQWVKEKPAHRCRLVDKKRNKVKHQCQETCGTCQDDIQRELATSSIDPYRKQGVGKYCEQDSDCASWSCQQNICYKSDECKPLKHFPGQRFDEDMIILIFVGSGFTDLDVWRGQVAKTFNVFKEFEVFEFTNTLYTAFFVDELIPEGYCEFKCGGSPTLLCCDLEIARRLESKCAPGGPAANVQTIVIENSDEYGGGGYLDDNMATTSTHELGPKVAVHELGHSLFELGDEYVTGPFTAKWSANCDYDGCQKWADLDEHLGGGLCSLKGCKGGDYFVGEESFMQFLDKPFGEVNTRYTCCTYIAFTGSYPDYCERYEFGNGLIEYCENDHQHYGIRYEMDRLRFDIEDYSQGKYILAVQPAFLLVNLASGRFTYESDMEGEGPLVVSRRKYRGDYADLNHALDEGSKYLRKIKIEFDSGEKQILYFSQEEALESPPFADSGLQIDDTAKSNNVTYVEIVIDARRGIVVGIDIEDMTIKWWHVLLIGLQNIWNFIKSLFTKKPVGEEEHSDHHDFIINDRL